jgi:hypothetical protein
MLSLFESKTPMLSWRCGIPQGKKNMTAFVPCHTTIVMWSWSLLT